MRQARNPVVRSFWYQQHADGQINVGVILPDSRLLHDSSLAKGNKSEKTWWMFNSSHLDIAPGFMSFESKESVEYGRSLARFCQCVLRRIAKRIAMKKPTMTTEMQLAQANDEIVRLKARVKRLEARRK